MAEQGFDEETGEPKHGIEMESWPYHNLLLKKSFSSKHSRRCEAPRTLSVSCACATMPEHQFLSYIWLSHEHMLWLKQHARWGRLLSEGLLPFQPAAYGLHNALCRHELLLRRARRATHHLSMF